MPPAAVICDIDGCLAPETSEAMDADALARLAHWNRNAIREGDRPIVTLCSGRPEPFVEAMCRLIANTRLPAIAENGVWLYMPDANRYERDPSITQSHLDAVHALESWARRELGPRGVTIQPGKSCSVTLYHEDTAYLRSLVPMLQTACRACAWPFRVSMTLLYINCDLAFVSKGTAVRRWIARTGIDRAHLLAIGDTAGDLVVRDEVARFACPANAQERVREQADFVAGKPEIEGVMEILEWARTL